MLTAETEARLEQAKALENNYQPLPEVADQLADKTLIMIVAPACMGKSALIETAAKTNPDFGVVPVFTTRDSRPDDDRAAFRFVPHSDESIAQLLAKIENREVIQYVIHPTLGRIYGTELSDYQKPYNLLATVSTVAQHLRSLPFGRTLVICIVTEPETWKRWLLARYPEPSEERTKRIAEAVQSLEWSLAQPESDVLWLNNRDGELAVTTERLIGQARGETGSDSEARAIAQQCLELAKTL